MAAKKTKPEKKKAPAAAPSAKAKGKGMKKPGEKEFASERRLKKAASEVRNLAIVLDVTEQNERGQELARANVKLQALVDAWSAAGNEHRKKVKEAKKEIDRLTRVVGEGKEYRDVTVLLVESEDGRGMDIVRADTREIVERRPFTPEERQRKLFKDTDKATEKAIAKGFKAEKEAAAKEAEKAPAEEVKAEEAKPETPEGEKGDGAE